MVKKSITIGALVGMGPNSTGPFYDRVITYARKLYGAKYDIDFPKIVLISLPTPFYPKQEIDDALMLTALKSGIEDLNKLAVDYIVIPCNVAHKYYTDLLTASSAPILNIIDIATDKLKNTLPSKSKIALIATATTVKTNLYQDGLKKIGMQIFHSEELQNIFDKLLLELKELGITAKAELFWSLLEKLLVDNNCQAGLIACTDISPLLTTQKSKLTYLDSMDSLAEATILRYSRCQVLTKDINTSTHKT
jgi:aspartate racemase